MIDDDDLTQRVTIILELPGWPNTGAVAVQAALHVLDRLERDGLRPYRTIIDVTEGPTT